MIKMQQNNVLLVMSMMENWSSLRKIVDEKQDGYVRKPLLYKTLFNKPTFMISNHRLKIYDSSFGGPSGGACWFK